MKNRRFRPLIFAVIALVAVWGLAITIFHLAGRTKMTADKVEDYAASVDFASLTGAERADAIRKLEAMANALTFAERQKWRRDDFWKKWFAAMTEDERLKFIEATLPTGFQQTLDAFSKLPDDKRKKFIDDSLKRIQEEGNTGVHQSAGDFDTNGPPPLSPELEQKVRELGLQQIYTGSSAETKSELAPLLEEMQRQIQNGRMR